MEIKCRRMRLTEIEEYIWESQDDICDCLAMDDRFTPMEASMFAKIIGEYLIEHMWLKSL